MIKIFILLFLFFLFYNLFNLFINKLYLKKNESFSFSYDRRCKKKGQVFSDFPPGMYCVGKGIVGL